ncbi:MAG: ferric reductase-like transmembrane domain-containing protein [Saprospiraceae bacterium]|nr:ferric reductase-like transmembrane domain-containing protein [Saprospiraceae bacterium]
MGVTYKSILWNRNKKKYDVILAVGVLFLVSSFIVFQIIFHPTTTIETIIIRASAFCAIVLLHIILTIGPLARIDVRFLPLLYNRRHLGVTMFFLALIHGVFSIVQFHAGGDTNPLVSVFVSNKNYQEISQFPFQILGFLALMILLLMAATSHDFWLKNLTPRIWKTLHMLVYLAYALIITHVALGTLQYEESPLYWILLTGGFLLIAGLHLYSGFLDNQKLRSNEDRLQKNGFVKVGRANEIEENRAKIFFIRGENIAIFKYNGNLSAVNNVCRHQLGPLGEGKIIEGCITCPWHGYQYLPANGQSPPPFHEKVSTYHLQINGGELWLNPNPTLPGTFVEPAKIEEL